MLVSEILTSRFLIDLVSVDRISLTLQISNGHAHPLERSVSFRVMAIERNDSPELPLRETVYELSFEDVSSLRMDLPDRIEESTLDMDVDDVTLEERSKGIHTLRFLNGHSCIEIDFKDVMRALISTKECAR